LLCRPSRSTAAYDRNNVAANTGRHFELDDSRVRSRTDGSSVGGFHGANSWEVLPQPSCAFRPAWASGAHKHADVRVGQTSPLLTCEFTISEDGEHSDSTGWASEQSDASDGVGIEL